jgi:hypothetical protein
MKAFGQITDPEESDRFAQELTALGNRILSANLVNLGELEGIRPALEEMRDFLTIGLEHLTGGRPESVPEVLRKSYIQSVFKIGFDQVARLREDADQLAQIRGVQMTALDEEDQHFVEALRRFKPLLIEDGHHRNFRSLADVEQARERLRQLRSMVDFFAATFPAAKSLRKTFNTATVQYAVSRKFEPTPLNAAEVEAFVRTAFSLPEVDVPAPLQPFAERWWKELREELEPLIGKPIDARFIESIYVV